jgi:hypothetical protein
MCLFSGTILIDVRLGKKQLHTESGHTPSKLTKG